MCATSLLVEVDLLAYTHPAFLRRSTYYNARDSILSSLFEAIFGQWEKFAALLLSYLQRGTTNIATVTWVRCLLGTFIRRHLVLRFDNRDQSELFGLCRGAWSKCGLDTECKQKLPDIARLSIRSRIHHCFHGSSCSHQCYQLGILCQRKSVEKGHVWNRSHKNNSKHDHPIECY